MRTEQVLQLHPVRLPEHLQLRQRRELYERDHALPRPRVLLSSGCWSCTGPAFACKTTGCYCRLKITCCDCATSGCGDSSGRCISWYVTTQLLGCAPTG